MKVGDTAGVCHHDLTIENDFPSGELLQRLGNWHELLRPVIASAGIDQGSTAIEMTLRAVAVVLDLVQPRTLRGHGCTRCGQARLDKSGVGCTYGTWQIAGR